MNSLRQLLMLCLCFSASRSLNTVLNLDEINSIHYAIDIHNKPVIKDQQVYEGEVMTVVNKFGQEYVCALPKVAPSDSDGKNEENILDQLVDISGLLKPMETAPCLIKTVDWWTYEFCYGSVIKQYHLEDNKASGPILILGKYESEYNWKNSSETKNRLQRFHSQFYVNGTKCDLTGEPRRTEVRFHCEDGVGDYIQRVDEPESCRYVVTVATTRVCHHPYLRLQAVRTPHAITCAPSLTEDQYNKYLNYQDKKAKEEETLKEKWLKQNAEILGEADRQETQSILRPYMVDENDELKMNIKIFKLSPVKKNKNPQSTEIRDVMEVETQFTLENNDPQLKVEDLKLSTETETPAGNIDNTLNTAIDPSDSTTTSDIEGQGEELTETSEVDDKDEDQLLSDVQAQKLLHMLDNDDSYLNEEDELNEESSKDVGGNEDDEDDDDDDEDEEEDDDEEIEDDDDEDEDDAPGEQNSLKDVMSSRLGSKSTETDHFAMLQERLKQLGEMFTKPMEDGGVREVNSALISEIHNMVNNIDDDQIDELEQEVKEWSKKMRGKDNVKDEDEDEEKQKIGTAFSSFMDALDKAEDKLTNAKKEMETLEKYLDNQLKEMEILKIFDGENADVEKVKKGKGVDSKDSTEEGSDIKQESTEDTSSKASKKKTADKNSGSTRQLRIMKNKMEDETQKTKLEQTIKDRLQKLGLEKISRKFEVKILTPNSLEDEDPTNPMLSQEETEAFQNMIVNLLSANAEELEERENHRKLEKNYGFKWDDTQLAEDEDE